MSDVQAAEVRTLAETMLEVRGTQVRTIVGRAAPYGEIINVAGRFTEEFVPGVFAKSVTEAARALPLLVSHNHDSMPVGKAIKWEDTTDGLVGHWQIDSRAEAAEVARLADEGYLTALSVGFTPVRDDWDRDAPVPHVRRLEAKLFEVSLVSVPAYDEAKILAVRSAGVPDDPATVLKPTPNLDVWRLRLQRMKGAV